MGAPPSVVNQSLLLQLSTTKPLFVDTQSWKSRLQERPPVILTVWCCDNMSGFVGIYIFEKQEQQNSGLRRPKVAISIYYRRVTIVISVLLRPKLNSVWPLLDVVIVVSRNTLFLGCCVSLKWIRGLSYWSSCPITHFKIKQKQKTKQNKSSPNCKRQVSRCWPFNTLHNWMEWKSQNPQGCWCTWSIYM